MTRQRLCFPLLIGKPNACEQQIPVKEEISKTGFRPEIAQATLLTSFVPAMAQRIAALHDTAMDVALPLRSATSNPLS